MDDHEFRRRADNALTELYNALAEASDDHDFEADFGGALTIEFDDAKAKFVVSPNSPVKQIWVSAHSKSFKLDWSSDDNAFVLSDTGQTLKELIRKAIEEQIGEPVEL